MFNKINEQEEKAMTVKDQQKTGNKPQILLDMNPTSSTDMVVIGHRADGTILLRMISLLPENVQVENHRTIISGEVAKSLVDKLCLITEYYPKKPRAKKKQKKK